MKAADRGVGVDAVALDAEHGRLGEAGEGLVHAPDREVGTGLERRAGQAAAEAVVEAPGVVGDQRQVARVAGLGEARDIAAHLYTH